MAVMGLAKNYCLTCKYYKRKNEYFAGSCELTGKELNSYKRRSPLSYGCAKHIDRCQKAAEEVK